MSDFFRNLKVQGQANAGLTIAFGILLLVAPYGFLTFLLRIVGWILLIMGIVGIVGGAGTMSDGLGGGALIIGIIQSLFGFWVIRRPGSVVSAVATVAGILLLIHAVNDLQYAFGAHRANAANWASAAISGAITLILALIVLFNPFGTALSLITLAGVCLILDGVSDLLLFQRLGHIF